MTENMEETPEEKATRLKDVKAIVNTFYDDGMANGYFDNPAQRERWAGLKAALATPIPDLVIKETATLKLRLEFSLTPEFKEMLGFTRVGNNRPVRDTYYHSTENMQEDPELFRRFLSECNVRLAGDSDIYDAEIDTAVSLGPWPTEEENAGE